MRTTFLVRLTSTVIFVFFSFISVLGVLFDLDGTLIDSTEVHLYSFLDALDSLGIPRKQNVENRFRSEVGKRFVDIVRDLYPELSEEQIHAIRQKKWEFTPKYLNRIRVLPHVYDTLNSGFLALPTPLLACILMLSSPRRMLLMESQIRSLSFLPPSV